MAQDTHASGSSPRWFAEGLRFECVPDCGACCTNHDDYAYVYLEGDDFDRLAGFLELDDDTFIARYTDLNEGALVLRMDEPDCPFLDGVRCSVYPARPTQCRTFPFWEETLTTPKSWERLRSFCPGIDRGPRHDLLQIEENIELRRQAERGR